MIKPLSRRSIDAALKELPGWSYQDNALRKTFKCKNFREAISWIVRMAFFAEEQNHHPELTNVYSRITVALSTHEAGSRVTARDIQLARSIEQFSWL